MVPSASRPSQLSDEVTSPGIYYTPDREGSESTTQISYGHTRTDSGSSGDQLGWSPPTYARRTTRPIQYTLDSLTESLSNSHMEDSGSAMVDVSAWSGWEWNDVYDRYYRYRENPAEPDGYEYQYGESASASSRQPKRGSGKSKGKSKK